MSTTYVSESMMRLINAVNKYQEKLQINKQILINAANVCDATMGSDQISQRHISELNEALKRLEEASQCAAIIASELIAKQLEADEI